MMMMRIGSALPLLATLLAIFSATPARAGEGAQVIGNDTYLRVHIGWHEAKSRSEPVPANWTAPEFDDGDWAREHAPLRINAWPRSGMQLHDYHLVLARARFKVADPAKVKNLTLSVSCVGGLVVYLNGKELKRAHLPAGKLDFKAEAEQYPKDAYVDSDGKRIQDRKKNAKGFALRIRKIELTVPAASLRKGVNVLAFENRRAKLNDIWKKSKWRKAHWRGPAGVWHHAGIVGLSMTAAAGSGVEPNFARPNGMQIWTPQPHETILAWHYGDPCEKPAIALQSPRNGSCSGVVMVSSTGVLKGVKAAAGDLVAEGGAKIPASAIRVRYAEFVRKDRSFNGNPGYDGLLDEPPAEVQPTGVAPKSRWRIPYAVLSVKPVSGANLPVWFTVKVPADAKPGLYKGKVSVEADGLGKTEVPVKLIVFNWKLPDAGKFVTYHNLYQSHESSAIYYKVAPWSDKHFELMGQVLELSSEIGNRICMIHMIKDAYHLHNKESMVRWIKKADGSFDYDFTIFDRYLDLYAKKIGKPKLLLLTVFQPYADKVNKTTKKLGGADVNVIDPKTKKLGLMRVPAYGTKEGEAFWKAALTAVKQRLQKRGWWDVAVIGTGSDNRPKATTVGMFKRAMPELNWMSSAHPNPGSYPTDDKKKVPVSHREHVWSAGILYNPDYNKYVKNWKGQAYPRPWKRGPMAQEWGFMRYGVACIYALYESSRPIEWRVVNESTLQGNLIGVGRVGLDFWPLRIPGKRERYQAMSGGVGAHLGPSAATRHFIYPGPKGPCATTRFELFREGLQTREAIIYVQQALDAKKISGDLQKRCLDHLDVRARHYLRSREGQPMIWTVFEGSGWQGRDAKLYKLCADVAKVLGE